MKRYSILIHGTGTCGAGTPDSADMALQKLLEQLRVCGHSLTSVSMVIDGSTVPIIGAMQPHPAADAPASPDAVSLVSVQKLLELVNDRVGLLLPQGLAQEAVLDGQSPAEGVTLETISKQLLQLQDGQSGLGLMLSGLKKEGGAAKGPKAPKSAPAPKKEGGAAGDDKAALGQMQETKTLELSQGPQPPLRDIDSNGCCTRCGAMFEDEVEGDAHLNGPMCEHKDALPPSDPPPTEHQEVTGNNEGTQPPTENKES